MSKTNHTFCLGYDIFEKSLVQLPLYKKTLISTINQYSYCIAEKDSDFKKSLKESEVLLPDGIGIVMATKFLYGKKIKKIAGADIHQFLLEKLNNENGSCFYLGSSDTTLMKISKRIKSEYPNIRVDTYSPPFKPVFTEKDNDEIFNVVNQFKPDVLFVGMTAPKQEKWSYENKNALDAKVICSIGAVFDFYAGTVKRPKKIWIDLGLEWLGRLFKEPKRMWKRYIYYGFVFLGYLLKNKWTLTFKKK
ncbi:WecB/TagA/CpsF family glycosyltransferase [Maribacter algarum]|uniref:WecB/TagA/CpsF family glycosyltransferase n=1 Tax=Maribacter algarum (ex Zhang et al. 2020) TaxID=2578118 RepID=A0A5S3PT84_9FLAO|nr:WecB/TagA/CpsF family glycosyltransferase [Maribacter algarum]TMM58209.1 WecB/TagA/CpsF family glycosyltransferase [Maribacter algarum]